MERLRIGTFFKKLFGAFSEVLLFFFFQKFVPLKHEVLVDDLCCSGGRIPIALKRKGHKRIPRRSRKSTTPVQLLPMAVFGVQDERIRMERERHTGQLRYGGRLLSKVFRLDLLSEKNMTISVITSRNTHL